MDAMNSYPAVRRTGIIAPKPCSCTGSVTRFLGSHVRSSWAAISRAPERPCQELLGGHIGASWAAMSGDPGKQSQGLLSSHLSPTKVPNKPQAQGRVPGKHERKQIWCEPLSPAEKAINSHVRDLQLEGRLIFL